MEGEARLSCLQVEEALQGHIIIAYTIVDEIFHTQTRSEGYSWNLCRSIGPLRVKNSACRGCAVGEIACRSIDGNGVSLLRASINLNDC